MRSVNDSNTASGDSTTSTVDVNQPQPFTVRPVADGQWSIVAWLWQAYRHDLATIVHGYPYADGRYQASVLDDFPTDDGIAYLAWRTHPKTGEDAPIGFAVVKGLIGEHRTLEGFWVTPMARRGGVGTAFAQQVLSMHEGPWVIAFQHDNAGATVFWRHVAHAYFGPENWSEDERPVPGLPNVPPDHFIVSRVTS